MRMEFPISVVPRYQIKFKHKSETIKKVELFYVFCKQE